MIRLSATTESLELETSATASIDYNVSFTDMTATTSVLSSSTGNVATITTTTIVAAPAAATVRQIQFATFKNKSLTVSNTITVKKDISTVEFHFVTFVIRPGQTLQYTADNGWTLLNSVIEFTDAVFGVTIDVGKVGTAPEGAGIYYSFSKDAGVQGAWSPGAPGLNGRATDGLSAADAGCIPLWTPAGSIWNTDFTVFSNTASMFAYADTLWVNTGLVVTTTTAQAITPVAIPARDQNGTVNGEGVQAALLVTTATTNAGNITNCTISYTNQAGVSGRTGIMASFPLTANVGTVVQFQLQAGDTGVRSVQSVTLGTSLITGAVSLILMRKAVSSSVPNSNMSSAVQLYRKQSKIFNNSCLLPIMIGNSATATTFTGSLTFEDR